MTDIKCPNCSKDTKYYLGPKQIYRGPILQCVEENYSGCGIDICRCDECGKAYEITYKIDEAKRLGSDWDGPSREERESDRLKAKLCRVERLRKQADELEKEATQ